MRGVIIAIVVLGALQVAILLTLLARPDSVDFGLGDGGPVVGDTHRVARIEDQLERLEVAVDEARDSVRALARSVGKSGGATEGENARTALAVDAAFADRLESLTRAVEDLASRPSMSIPVDPEAIVAADGYLIADRLADEGRPGRAADAYLRFVEAHRDHPDAKDLQQKARDQLLKAGYASKAIDVQRDLVERYEASPRDFLRLAQMEKGQRLYDEAIASAGRAIELEAHDEQRMWHELYRAWYVELRDGDAAALDEYRRVQGLIDGLGLKEGHKLNEKVRGHIEQAERRVAAK